MKIQKANKNNIENIVQLEQRIWGNEGATEEQIRSRINIFQDGSIIALLPNDQVIGYVVVQRVSKITMGSWAKQTDHGSLTVTHKPSGKILYGVNLTVAPEGAKLGVSSALIEYCYHSFVKTGECSTICLGSRLPGYARWYKREGGNVRQYLNTTAQGKTRDPELRLYESKGFHFLWEIKDYFPDPDSLNYGAMIYRN